MRLPWAASVLDTIAAIALVEEVAVQLSARVLAPLLAAAWLDPKSIVPVAFP